MFHYQTLAEILRFSNSITSLDTQTTERVVGLKIRLRSASIESLDALEKCLEALKNAPSKSMGFIEIVAPLGAQRDGHWRLAGKLGVDESVQAAIKATKLVETIEEIAA